MKKFCLFVVLMVFTGALSFPARLAAYPEPAIFSRAWQLDFTYQHPRAIAIRNLAGQHVWYWFMPYKVVNNSDSERVFIPDIIIATDQGDVIQANTGVPRAVFDAIKDYLGNPLLERPDEMIDKMLRGEDYARESVIIWPIPANRHDVVDLSVFVGGLSGETAAIKHPISGEPVVLRKTLMINYATPGKPQSPQAQPVVFKGDQWIMR